MAKRIRKNEEIRIPTVRVISEDGKQLGIMAVEKALQLARAQELDLIEIAPNVHPPVCKILDYGKYLYQQQKSQQRQRKMEIKGVRIGFRTSEHDLETKMQQARKFLGKRHPVKVQMLFKGREIAYANLGREKFMKFIDALSDIGKPEGMPKRQGHTLITILTPL